MNRFMAWGVAALTAFTLSGCGLSATLVTPEGQAEASGLFSPKLPADRVLTAEEAKGDFDRYLAIATAEAKRWSSKAVLSAAQATNVNASGGKAGGTTYVYLFAAGRSGLSVTVTGNAVSFAKAKPGLLLDSRELVSGARAMSAALASGKLSSEGYVLLLGAATSGPVYVVREFKLEGAASVTIDARTGAPIQ